MTDIKTRRWLSAAEIAAHVGISRATLYRYLDDGLPSHQPGGNRGRRLFDVDEVDEWLRNRCFDPIAGEDVA